MHVYSLYVTYSYTIYLVLIYSLYISTVPQHLQILATPLVVMLQEVKRSVMSCVN